VATGAESLETGEWSWQSSWRTATTASGRSRRPSISRSQLTSRTILLWTSTAPEYVAHAEQLVPHALTMPWAFSCTYLPLVGTLGTVTHGSSQLRWRDIQVANHLPLSGYCVGVFPVSAPGTCNERRPQMPSPESTNISATCATPSLCVCLDSCSFSGFPRLSVWCYTHSDIANSPDCYETTQMYRCAHRTKLMESGIGAHRRSSKSNNSCQGTVFRPGPRQSSTKCN
jgi:hypothetical protein